MYFLAVWLGILEILSFLKRLSPADWHDQLIPYLQWELANNTHLQYHFTSIMVMVGLVLLPWVFSFSFSKCIFLLIFCFLAGAQNFLVQMCLQMAQSWVLCGVWVDSAQPGTKLQSLIILERRAYVRFQYQTSRYQQCCAQALPNVTSFLKFRGSIWLSLWTEGCGGEYPEQPRFWLRALYGEAGPGTHHQCCAGRGAVP